MLKLRIPGRFIAAVTGGVIDFFRTDIYLGTSRSGAYIGFGSDPSPAETIDARIAKIDEAKERLIEGLSAIEELKSAATTNKKELHETLRRLSDIHDSKLLAERELTAIRAVASVDLSAFQKIAGVPSKRTIRLERTIGFVLGVLASLVASVIWWWVSS